MVKLEGVKSALDELHSCSIQLEQARAGCRHAVIQGFDDASEIGATIALRLQQYRDASNDHDPELVKKAESVEEDVCNWMPVLIAVRELVGRVSADRFLVVSRVAAEAMERHRATLSAGLAEFESIVTFAQTLAAAETLEARLEFLGSLSVEDLARIRSSATEASKRLHDELAALQDTIGHVIVAEAAIADTFGALQHFVEARTLALQRFVEATDYFRGLEPTRLSGRDVTFAGLKEGAKVAFEFTVTRLGPKILEQVPIIGVGISFHDLVQDMREKTKELQRRAEELQKLAVAHVARGETDEIFLLGRELKADIEMLRALNAYVDQLEHSLARLIESIARNDKGSGPVAPIDGT